MRIPDAPVSLANVPAQTTGTQIGLTWSDGSNNGGTPVIDYRVSFNGGSGSVYTTVESNIVTLPYRAVSLTPGTTYSFQVQSRNAFGYSPFSASVEILAAQIPDRPAAPSTVLQDTNILISWSAPFNQGSPITSYKIQIRQNDNSSYSLDLTNCDGSQQGFLTTTQCSVPVSVLRSAPFSLPWGSPVYATIIASNKYGDSLVSLPGSGGRIITYPDAPINVVENLAQRTESTLGISW